MADCLVQLAHDDFVEREYSRRVVADRDLLRAGGLRTLLRRSVYPCSEFLRSQDLLQQGYEVIVGRCVIVLEAERRVLGQRAVHVDVPEPAAAKKPRLLAA